MTDHLELYLEQKRKQHRALSLICFVLQQDLSRFLTSRMHNLVVGEISFSCQAVQGIVPHRRHNDLLRMRCFLLQSAQMENTLVLWHCCLLESQKSLIPGCSLDAHNCIRLLERICLLHLQLVPASAPQLSER